MLNLIQRATDFVLQQWLITATEESVTFLKLDSLPTCKDNESHLKDLKMFFFFFKGPVCNRFKIQDSLIVIQTKIPDNIFAHCALKWIIFISFFTSTSIYKTESHPAPCHSDSSGQTCFLYCGASYTNPSGNLILSKHSSHSSCYISRYWLQPKVIFKDVVFLTSSSFPRTAGGSVCLPLLHLERCYKNSSLSSDTLFVFFFLAVRKWELHRLKQADCDDVWMCLSSLQRRQVRCKTK